MDMKQSLAWMTAVTVLHGAVLGCQPEVGAGSEELSPGQRAEPIVLELVEVRVWAADRGALPGQRHQEARTLVAAATGEGSTGVTAQKVVADRQEAAPVGTIVEVTDGERVAGETRLALPRSTRSTLRAWEPSEVTMRVCMSRDGMPVNVAILSGSGFAGADDRVKDTIMKTWRYQPYRANGDPIPVCQRITFRYELHHADSKPVLF
jgi:hypothetical protein